MSTALILFFIKLKYSLWSIGNSVAFDKRKNCSNRFGRSRDYLLHTNKQILSLYNIIKTLRCGKSVFPRRRMNILLHRKHINIVQEFSNHPRLPGFFPERKNRISYEFPTAKTRPPHFHLTIEKKKKRNALSSAV